MKKPVVVSAKHLFLVLSMISAFFVLAHILGLIASFGFGHNNVFGLVPFFHMVREYNAPATWSTLLLLTAAGLLALVAREMKRRNDRYVPHWSTLSGIFVLLAIDEFLQFHERVNDLLAEAFSFSGVLAYPWVIMGGVVVLIVGISYLRFLFSLPGSTRNLFILAACLYVGGALGFELIEAAIEDAGPWDTLPYMICVTIEETLEMVGVCLFCYAITRHAAMLPRDATANEGRSTGPVVWRP